MVTITCPNCGWSEEVDRDNIDGVELRETLCEDGCRKTLEVKD